MNFFCYNQRIHVQGQICGHSFTIKNSIESHDIGFSWKEDILKEESSISPKPKFYLLETSEHLLVICLWPIFDFERWRRLEEREKKSIHILFCLVCVYIYNEALMRLYTKHQLHSIDIAEQQHFTEATMGRKNMKHEDFPKEEKKERHAKNAEKNATDQDINVCAEAFIKNFRHHLLLQRLQSMDNLNQTISREH